LRRLSGCQAELDAPAEEQLVAMPWRRQTSATQTPGFSVSCTAHFCSLLKRPAVRPAVRFLRYLPGSAFAAAPDVSLLDRVERAGRSLPEKLHRGSTWTTDAPYRETEAAIAQARDLGTLAVEMEAAALYAFGTTSGNSIVCFAHVTNSMAQTEGDFEKGKADGAKATLAVAAAAGRGSRSYRS
jgi:uridine phosphorylase